MLNPERRRTMKAGRAGHLSEQWETRNDKVKPKKEHKRAMKAGVPVILVSGAPAIGASCEQPKSTPFSQPPAYGTHRSEALVSASGRGQNGGCLAKLDAVSPALLLLKVRSRAASAAISSAAMSQRGAAMAAAVSLPRPAAAGGSGTAVSKTKQVTRQFLTRQFHTLLCRTTAPRRSTSSIKRC